MTRTISSTESLLVTLSDSLDNSVTITSSGVLGAGLYGFGLPEPWVVLNYGSILGSGVTLLSAGTLTNAGSITGQGPLPDMPAILLTEGGTVSNQSGGTISGVLAIYGEGGSMAVTNSGSIAASRTGVQLAAGGNITNAQDGVIDGTWVGVYGNGGTATVTNAGSIAAYVGVLLEAGGSVSNQAGGVITGTADQIGSAVYGANQAVTVDNAGIIATNYSRGVKLSGGGTVTNHQGGRISGFWSAIYSKTQAATVINNGEITGESAVGKGIVLQAGGSITNQSGGTIISGYFTTASVSAAVYFGEGAIAGNLAPLTVVNAGVVAGDSAAGIALVASSSITNQSGGTISGYDAIHSKDQTSLPALVVLNEGEITASHVGIFLGSGGTITNAPNGIIRGGYGIASYVDRFAGQGIGAVTIINSGTIIGSRYAVDLAGGYANHLVIDPGARFTGVVAGGGRLGGRGTSTLELAAGASPGTLDSLGSQFIGFPAIDIDAGAEWLLHAGTAAANVSNQGILEVGSQPGSGGLLQIAGSLDGSGDTIIDPGATLEIDGTLDTRQTLRFATGSPATLALDGGGRFSAAQLPFAPNLRLAFGAVSGTMPTLAITGSLDDRLDTVVDGSMVDLSGASAAGFAAALRVSSGGIQFGDIDSVAYAGFTQAGGTISGTGTLTAFGNTALSGGWQTGSGTTRLTAFASLTGLLQLVGGRTLQNDGVLSLAQGGLQLGAANSTAATDAATLLNTGVISITGPIRISAPDAAGTVRNTGILTATLGHAEADIDAAVDNPGLIAVHSGTLSLNGGGTARGSSLQIAAGATLQFGPQQGGVAGAAFNIQGAFHTAGTFSVSAGTLVLSGAEAATGIFLLDGSATLDFVDGLGFGSAVGFLQPGGTLVADKPFNPAVWGFAGGDVLDAFAVSFATAAASFGPGGLAVSDGTHAVVFRLEGNSTQAGFHLASDSHGGTAITYG